MSDSSPDCGLFQTAVKQLVIPLVQLGPDFNVVYANSAACEFLKYPLSEIINTEWLVYINPEDRITLSEIQDELNTSVAAKLEKNLRYIDSQGNVFLTTSYLSHLHDHQNCPVGYLLQINNIQEPGQSLDEQKESVWRDVFENANWGVVVGSGDGVFLQEMNSAFANMHGYSVGELTGKAIVEVFAEECRADLEKKIKIAHESGYCAFESTHIRKDGTRFPVFIDISVVYDENKRVKYRVVNVQDISRQKNIEKSLRYFQDLVESSMESIISMSIDGVIRGWNKGAEHVYGYSKNEVIGKSIELLFTDQHKDVEQQMLKNIRRGNGSKDFETVRRTRDGRDISVSVRYSTVVDGMGQIVGLSEIDRDVTERSEMEGALRHSEKNMIEAQRISKLGSWELDHKSGSLLWSEGIYRIFGLDSDGEKLSYENFIQLVHEDDQQAVHNAYQYSLQTRKPYQIVHRIVMPDGKIKWVEERCETLYDEDGVALRSMGTVQDVTVRERIEEELQHQENKYHSLVDNSPHIIMRFDENCNRVYVNPAFSKQTGMTLTKKTLSVKDDQWGAGMSISLKEFNGHLREVMQTGNEKEILLDWYNPITGEVSNHVFNVVSEYRPDGKLLGTLVIGNNITSLKETERELKDAHKQLRGLSEALENIREEERKRISRDLHDELGQLLTGMRMKLSILRMQIGDNETLLNQVKLVGGLIDKTIGVVREIAASLRPAPLDMGLASALEWMSSEFSRRSQVVCHLHIDNDDIQVEDRVSTALFRIVQESLTNVMKYADATQVDIYLSSDVHCITLEICDNGIGFDVSIRKDNSFGLLGIRERAVMVGGEAIIDSRPGHGTVVAIKIPFAKEKLET